MRAVICTLFERDYHLGLAALANSLCRHGFKGTIVAGYRGALPPWLKTGGLRYEYAQGAEIEFVQVDTPMHLTNFKPSFMLEVMRRPEYDAICYFDPDIVVRCRWSFFEEWVQAGVALCEDVNPSMAASHPLRHAWKKYFSPKGMRFTRECDAYYNGGFVGVTRDNMGFVEQWRLLLELMAPEIGGLGQCNVGDRTFAFCKTDQDALNIAAMTSAEPLSVMGQDAMDFQQGGGGYVMSHAAGGTKPWRKCFFLEAAAGRGPTRAERQYFEYAAHPIQPYGVARWTLKRADLALARLVGRLIK